MLRYSDANSQLNNVTYANVAKYNYIILCNDFQW